MAGSLVVARYRDGRVVKGTTTDFSPLRDRFHVDAAGAIEEVLYEELKAIFFVRDLGGNARHKKLNAFVGDQPVIGRKLAVEFTDGEMLLGTTQGYRPDRKGFFVVPADPKSNAVRCYVITSATRRVKMG